jgi:hypothetical protein
MMTEYDIQILAECAGLKPAQKWGAAVGACLEYLGGNGYIDSRGKPTELGWKALADVDATYTPR